MIDKSLIIKGEGIIRVSPLNLYGSRMSESILAILCHIIKGEGIIRVSLDSCDYDTFLFSY